MAISPAKSENHAKIGDLQPPAWEKYFEIGLSWRFFHDKAKLTPNPATRDARLGKTYGKRFIMAISPRKSRDHAKTHNPRSAWGKSKRNPFIMAIAKKTAIGLAKPFGRVSRGNSERRTLFPRETRIGRLWTNRKDVNER